VRSETETALRELEALRSELLDYDARADRDGMRWDGLVVRLDRRILVLIELVGKFDAPSPTH